MQFTIPFSLPFALSFPSLFSIHLERTNHLPQPCDPKRPSYRMMQCASFNDKMPLSDNKLHNWTAHMARNLDPCILYCLNEENSFVILQKMVNDSTPCKAGTNNMCVAGLCRVRHITSLLYVRYLFRTLYTRILVRLSLSSLSSIRQFEFGDDIYSRLIFLKCRFARIDS